VVVKLVLVHQVHLLVTIPLVPILKRVIQLQVGVGVVTGGVVVVALLPLLLPSHGLRRRLVIIRRG